LSTLSLLHTVLRSAIKTKREDSEKRRKIPRKKEKNKRKRTEEK
jgi:hypothetical protein